MPDGKARPPVEGMQETIPEGEQYLLREYENPLPKEVQNRDYLNIQIRLYHSASYLYFDGKSCYMLPFESKDVEIMTAALQRTDAKTRHFEGKGTYNGSNVRIEADASAVHAQMIVSSDTDMFIPLGGDSWYDLVVRDTQGVALRTTECWAIDTRTIHATLEETGFLPDGLSEYILVASEGEWDEASAIAAAMPIQLTMEK